MAVVMKFGGTSVEDARAIERAAEIVIAASKNNLWLWSARWPRSRTVFWPALALPALVTGRKRVELSRALRERHYNVAGELLGTGVFTQFHSQLEAEFDSLDELLRGVSAVGELTPRTLDNVASYGERISSTIVTAAFSTRELPSELRRFA